jgi:uncharacterized protein (DUF1697 family)
MKFVALLRGINVGGKNKVDMKILKVMMESLDYSNVKTYLNTGNIIFEAKYYNEDILINITNEFYKTFGFKVAILIKKHEDIKRISDELPVEWKNDSDYKSDVAFLFTDIDSKDTINKLPVNGEYIDIRYIDGAIIWRVKRSDYNKSKLSKIASSKYYKSMTIRNVNTVRKLSEI